MRYVVAFEGHVLVDADSPMQAREIAASDNYELIDMAFGFGEPYGPGEARRVDGNMTVRRKRR